MDHQYNINREQQEFHKDYIIKASFKDCPLEERKNFINSSCIVPISVGQEAHEGKKFISTLELINKSFKQVTILVVDSLQRYTLAIKSGKNTQQEYELALYNGDEWIKRNKVYIENMTIPYKILRCNDYINCASFNEQLDLVEKLYKSDKEYKDKFNSNAESFLNRYNKRTPVLQQDTYLRAYELCLKYLKEECACMCLWAKDYYDFEVYPTGRNQAMSITYEKIIKSQYPNLLKSVSIRFKKFYPENPEYIWQNSNLED